MTENFPNIYVSDHILVQHFLTILRRDECKHAQYRLCISQIYLFLTYEALLLFKTPVGLVDLTTPIGAKVVDQKFIQSGQIAIVAVMRGGLAPGAVVNGLLPKASLSHVGMQGGKKSGKAKIFYERFPTNMKDKQCLVIAPRIETGASVVAVLDRVAELRKDSALSDIVIINIVCAPEGARELLKNYPDVRIVTASLEIGLQDGEVIPGIGRTGERVYETVDLEEFGDD